MSKKILALGIGLASLAGCASVPPPSLSSSLCHTGASRLRGEGDALDGRPRELAFLNLCEEGSRAAIRRAYREGYAAGLRSHHAVHALSPDPAPRPELTAPLARALASPAWVCEVESSAKVFTGVGLSEREAGESARSVCGAHFSENACRRTECRQNF